MAQPVQPHVIFLPCGNDTPNHPRWPLLVYNAALRESRTTLARLKAHGWENRWRGSIYSFQHYHTTAHEVLVVASGWANVQFGGEAGEVLKITAGDAAVLPAGTGHRLLQKDAGFEVVGAYPKGHSAWDLKRLAPSAADLAQIARVPRPQADPVLGKSGGILELWPL